MAFSLKTNFKGNRTALCAAVMLALSSSGAQAQSEAQDMVAFDIPSQNADEALISFAKSANLTIIFSYEKARSVKANSLSGSFTVREALEQLLIGTGLRAEFNNKGTVSVTVDKSEIDEDVSILAALVDLFVGDGEKMQTTPEPDSKDIETIKVTGIRASVTRALDVKYSEVGVVDTIQTEEIGKFPDLNLAESLQRITGVSIDRSEGEGQFVTVRGFGPEFNTVLVNGRKLPTDNLGREFSFDTLPSELVSGVSVIKTSDASSITGGIGSVINIQTARPMQSRGFKVAGHVSALHDINSEDTSPQGALLVSHSNNKFGWLVSLSHQKRKAKIEEAQIDGWLLNTDVPEEELTTSAENLFVPRNYDQRVRFDTRTRKSGTLVLQYRPSEDLEMSLDFLASSFDVETDSTSLGHWFTSSNLEDVSTDSNGTAITFSQNVGHATDFHARTFNRPSRLQSMGGNIQWQVNKNLAISGDFGIAKSNIDDNLGAANALSLIGYLNRSSFLHSTGDILPHITGFESADPAIINAEGFQAGVSDYLDPANSRAHVILRRGWEIDDSVSQFRFDGVWSDYNESTITGVNFGVTYTHQEKDNIRWDNEKNAVHCTYCGYFSFPDIPNSFQSVFNAGSDFLSSISGSANIPKRWLRHDGNQLVAYLEGISGADFSPVRRDNSFTVDEEIFAAYSELQLYHEFGDIEIDTQIGMRFESTNVTVSGFESQLQRLDILDQTELAPITGIAEATFATQSDTQWLPSVLSRWHFSENLLLKVGYSKTITRPMLTELSPSVVFNTTRQGGDLRASQGNTQLQPFKSSNIDVSLEWYSQAQSSASIAYFRKSVDNFIVSTVQQVSFNNVVDPSTGNDPLAPDSNDDIAVFDLTSPINSETAVVEGIELAFQYHFTNGFGLLANTTFIDSNAEFDRNDISQKFALTGLSDTQNLILFYDRDNLQFRVAWNRRSDFLQSLTQSQSSEPTFVDQYDQIDINASYAITPSVSLFVEGINITEESVIKHGRFDNQLLLAQSPGARYSLGIRASF